MQGDTRSANQGLAGSSGVWMTDLSSSSWVMEGDAMMVGWNGDSCWMEGGEGAAESMASLTFLPVFQIQAPFFLPSFVSTTIAPLFSQPLY